ncbi:hypothetical protein X777_15308 [Ooceraea biroi]|nr:hypothetical protein X777_15308 [Ooceraea biroi]
MSVGSGGRAPFKRTTQNNPPLTKKSSGNQAKPAKEPAASAATAKPATNTGRKRDTVASLFSAKRPTSRKVERTISRGREAVKPGDQQLK